MTDPMITQDARLMAGSRAEQATGDRELRETAPRLVIALDTHTLIAVAPEPLPPVPPLVLPATPQTPRQGTCASVGPGIQSGTRDRSCEEPTRTKAADPWDSLQSEPPTPAGRSVITAGINSSEFFSADLKHNCDRRS